MFRIEVRVSLKCFSLGCFFFIISISDAILSDTAQKEYNYTFDVQPVDSCPMNELDWRAGAKKIGCSSSRGYHCIPDKFHESLIEFCYFKPRVLVSDGNCLELAANGILNHVKCHDFTSGCPNQPYLSDEIYRYPVCLSIKFGCFTSDIKCHQHNLNDSQTITSVMTSKSTPIDYKQQKNPNTKTEHGPWETLFAVFLALFIILLILFIVFGRISALRNYENKKERGADHDLSVLSVDNTYLSNLIRKLCRNGIFRNFEYLFKKRILEKKDDAHLQKILKSRDKDGYTLLHCAAVGGSTEIFEALVYATDNIKVDDTTYDGQTVLHIACKNNHVSLCNLILFENNFKTLLLNKISKPGWNAAHYAAAGASLEIINLLKDQGLDITVVTKNGLNILDIACLHNNKELCKDLINRDDFSLPLDKSDMNGWTIAHFAAMVGNNDVFDLLVEKNINPKKTNQQKTILHVSCEYGNHDICLTILEHFQKIGYDKDDEDWNALHYAAKGGNLKIYKEVEKLFKKSSGLCDITRDERNVLHIACINNSIEICQYICNKKAYKPIINSKGEFKDWTAAHYVAVETKEDGAEEKLIRILVKGGIDLNAVTTDGLTVLGVACEHRNRKLINYLLKEHSELLGVEISYLINAAKASNDENIESQIKKALENYKGEKVDIIAEINDDTERLLKWHSISKFSLKSCGLVNDISESTHL